MPIVTPQSSYPPMWLITIKFELTLTNMAAPIPTPRAMKPAAQGWMRSNTSFEGSRNTSNTPPNITAKRGNAEPLTIAARIPGKMIHHSFLFKLRIFLKMVNSLYFPFSFKLSRLRLAFCRRRLSVCPFLKICGCFPTGNAKVGSSSCKQGIKTSSSYVHNYKWEVNSSMPSYSSMGGQEFSPFAQT